MGIHVGNYIYIHKFVQFKSKIQHTENASLGLRREIEEICALLGYYTAY